MQRFFRVGLSSLLAVAVLAACSGKSNALRPNSGVEANQTDVTSPDDGVFLASGWYPTEHLGGDTFHWATNDAELVACPDASHHAVAMEVEPGPGLGDKKMTMYVTSSSHVQQVVSVPDRRVVRLVVPGSDPQTLRIHVPSPNKKTAHDPRALNFRIFSAKLGSQRSSCPLNIIHDDSSIVLGTGWYSFERFQGSEFRWVNNDAQIILTRDTPNGSTLELEAEPGPSLGTDPLVIQVLSRGKTLAISPAIAYRKYADFKLPPLRAQQTIVLHVASQNKPAANETRILNYRVFDVRLIESQR